MSRSLLAKLVLLVGILLLAGSALLFANGPLCIFNKASCGMVEPLLALPMLLTGLCLLVGGVLALRHSR